MVNIEKITDRIDNVTKVDGSYFNAILPAPKSVKIEISARCNYRCQFCALRTRDEQPKKDMDFDFFKKVTKELYDAGTREIGVFYLGESFTNPKLLIACIQYLKQELKMPYVFLTSNGSLATSEHVEECMKAGLDSLKWSINAADDKQFELIMGVSSDFQTKTFLNVKKAFEIRNEKGYKTGLYASSIEFGDEQKKQMESLLNEKVIPFVDQHYWLPLYSMGSIATVREEELGFKPTAGNQGRCGNLRDPLPCWCVFTEGHITVDGKLSACAFDATANWVIGDLNENNFMELWNSEEFIKLREAHINKNVNGTICEKCLLY